MNYGINEKAELPPPPSSVSNVLCCNVYLERYEFERVINDLDLSNIQKQIIFSRYIHIIEHLRKRVAAYSRVFYIGHTIITVGSLIVPALLSIQNSSSVSNYSITIYWSTFIISLLVTTFNGILTLFKIDKKYYFLNTILERLRTEGWQYLGLTGRYQSTNIQQSTHQNQFVLFTHQIEKIKMKQIEEEYYKSDENTTQTPQQGNTGKASNAKSDLYPPSPDQPITTLAGHEPEPVSQAVKSMIRVNTTTPLENVVVIPSNTDVPVYTSTIKL